MNRMLVTGSSGLIGSEVVAYFAEQGFEVFGLDNNMRADFFGKQADTSWNRKRMENKYKNFKHSTIDIRNRESLIEIIKAIMPHVIVHAAAQPSHDLAASRPFDDFDTNAVGTFNLLEAARLQNPEIVFVHMSTNKVYGDAPNEIKLKELETRWDYDDPYYTLRLCEDF